MMKGRGKGQRAPLLFETPFTGPQDLSTGACPSPLAVVLREVDHPADHQQIGSGLDASDNEGKAQGVSVTAAGSGGIQAPVQPSIDVTPSLDILRRAQAAAEAAASAAAQVAEAARQERIAGAMRGLRAEQMHGQMPVPGRAGQGGR